MRGIVFLAALALFASAESATSGAAALAPLKLGQKKSGDTLTDQAHVLWPQFEKTAAALDHGLSRAQADQDARLTRSELKAMIMLRLRLREMAGRRALDREELAVVLKEIEKAQKMTRKDRLADAFSSFHQQADEISVMLNKILNTMDKTDTALLVKNSA
ncbi:hypothetical protein [Hyphococcus luteus]|uniref:Periplasmic heavy metal sensor n=1 Tax=Hyphococcus luteus TaxID=2058213 RepID=A0A2S7K4X3_9PROT|nr:hypothetical protein [Marinicaulis flavus]PQA87488.1 hypothetical protein CW354_11840 [Marinicaulis flavus]